MLEPVTPENARAILDEYLLELCNKRNIVQHRQRCDERLGKGPQQIGTRMKIIIGNKNYSSWSLRGLLAVKQSGLHF